MTALAMAPAAPPRPVPWTRLAWVVWRRYRTTFAAVAGVLAVLAGYLLVAGERMRSAFATVSPCLSARSARCGYAYETFYNSYSQPGIVGVILLFLPGIVGAFVGAPVLARELETGTFRYAWTQGVGRMRWAVAAIVPAALAVAVIMGGFGALVTWYNQPLFASGITQRLHPTIFPVTGIAVAAWTLAGYALGVLSGLLWRRVLAALGTAFAAWFGLAFLAADVLRPRYLAPMTSTRLQLPVSDRVVNQWWIRHGVPVGVAQINRVLRPLGFQGGTDGKINARPGAASNIDPVQYLVSHGYTQVTSYQPDSRYWSFQWIEFGWLAVLAVLLLGATLWIVRRRPA